MDHRQTIRRLARHFFRRFLDNDLISPNGDNHVGNSQILAALIAPGVLVAVGVLFKYSGFGMTWQRLTVLCPEDALLMIAIAMIVTGIAATVAWDAFYLDARDVHILGVLPIPRWVITVSKLAAMLLLALALAAALGAIPVLLIPFFMLQRLDWSTSAAHFVPLTLAQAAAVVVPATWTILTVAAIRGILSVLLPQRVFRLASSAVQGLLILGFLAWFMLLPAELDGLRDTLRQHGAARDWMPPLWFLGIYHQVIGAHQLVGSDLAASGWRAIALAAAVTLVLFPLAPVSGDVGGAGSRGRQAWSAWARIRQGTAWLLVRSHPGRAAFSFTVWALARSAPHRLYLAAALGVGLAWSGSLVAYVYGTGGLAAVATPSTTMLEIQAVLVLATAVAVRFGVTMPVALKANWLFRVTEGEEPGRYAGGARAAALLVTLWPVAALLPVHLWLWGPRAAGGHALFGLLHASLLVALLFQGFAKVPCTAPYISGQLKLRSRGPHYLLGVWAVTWLPARIEEAAPPWGTGFTVVLSLMGVGILLMAVAWYRRVGQLPGLVFDDVPDDAVQTLGLME